MVSAPRFGVSGDGLESPLDRAHQLLGVRCAPGLAEGVCAGHHRLHEGLELLGPPLELAARAVRELRGTRDEHTGAVRPRVEFDCRVAGEQVVLLERHECALHILELQRPQVERERELASVEEDGDLRGPTGHDVLFSLGVVASCYHCTFE